MQNHTHDDDSSIDATYEQPAILKDLGVSDVEMEGLSYEDAEAMIDAMRMMQREAGKLER